MTRYSTPFHAMLLATTVLCTTTAARAQEYSGALTFGAARLSANGDDVSTYDIQGYIDADFGNGLVIGADSRLGRSDFGGDGGNLDSTEFRLTPRYRFASGLTLGAYVEHLNLSFDGSDFGLTSYGATLGYDTGALAVEAFVGQTDSDQNGSDKISDFGVNLVYSPADNLAVGGSLARSSSDGSDIDTFRLGGAYALNDSWTLFGAVESSNLGDLDITSFSAGASYDLTGLMGRPAAVSLELERTRLGSSGSSDDNINTVRLGVTIPFGKPGVQVPLNSAVHNALRPRHNAFPSLISQGLGA